MDIPLFSRSFYFIIITPSIICKYVSLPAKNTAMRSKPAAISTPSNYPLPVIKKPSPLGPRCSALPVADEAEHKRVPWSVCKKAAPATSAPVTTNGMWQKSLIFDGCGVNKLAAQGILTYRATCPLPYPYTPTSASCLSLALLRPLAVCQKHSFLTD